MPPPPKPSLSIVAITPHGDQLENIINLWRPERKRLGLFPKGAFEEYAARGGIHAALDSSGHAVGYIALRISSGWVHIAHLCVLESARNMAVARQLVERAFQIAQNYQCYGTRLKCRKDYPASDFWPRVGFHARATTSGRGEDPAELAIWIRKNEEFQDLFSSLTEEEPAPRTAILDANVFYDLINSVEDSDELPQHIRESLYLKATWVEDVIELGLVDEIFTEISKSNDKISREKHHQRALRYPEIPYRQDQQTIYIKHLEKILKWEKTNKRQKVSDIRQIAKAAASRAEFFVTRDQKLLQAAQDIEDTIPIRVVNPALLLSILDSETQGHSYSPARIFGTSITESSPLQDKIEQLCNQFRCRQGQENPHHFRTLTRDLSASSAGSPEEKIRLIGDQKQNPVLLYSKKSTDTSLTVRLLRTAVHPLAPTAVRHLLLQSIQKAAQNNLQSVLITDSKICPITTRALEDLHFQKSDDLWKRQLHAKVLSASTEEDWPKDLIRPVPGQRGSLFANWLEERYWPIKIRDAGINAVSITIKEHWAAKLFDGKLADQELFCIDPLKVFNRENVFYRSPRSWPTNKPRRILWYVSKICSYRACSRILDVVVGPAKEVFKRFERLGVYEWRDIEKLAAKNPQREIMAIHFSDTEIFPEPIDLSQAKIFGVGKIQIGAHPISEAAFLQIYSNGMNRNSA